MYARHVSYDLKPNQREEFNKTFEKDVLPLLQKQNGFTDEITFASPDGKNCIAISLWDRKEKAEAYGREAYPQVLKSLAKVIEGTPEVRGYEVTNSTFPKFAATR
jgi:heme-degrading monooxygenase HmoA